MSKSIEDLTQLIAELPGLGPRQARRVVQFLLRANSAYRQKVAQAILSIADHISQCQSCFRYDEVNQENRCVLCANINRDTQTLMVVEKDVDIDGIETAGIYNGQYFVLGSLMPLANTRKTAIKPRTGALKERAGQNITEVIFAFATTPEGDYTAQELKKDLARDLPQLQTSMLGRGLSLGAEIEYADQETLRNAFQGRH